MPVINFLAGSGAGPASLPWACVGAGASRRRLEAPSLPLGQQIAAIPLIPSRAISP